MVYKFKFMITSYAQKNLHISYLITQLHMIRLHASITERVDAIHSWLCTRPARAAAVECRYNSPKMARLRGNVTVMVY